MKGVKVGEYNDDAKNEMLRYLKKIKCGKSPVTDGVKAELLKKDDCVGKWPTDMLTVVHWEQGEAPRKWFALCHCVRMTGKTVESK